MSTALTLPRHSLLSLSRRFSPFLLFAPLFFLLFFLHFLLLVLSPFPPAIYFFFHPSSLLFHFCPPFLYFLSNRRFIFSLSRSSSFVFTLSSIYWDFLNSREKERERGESKRDLFRSRKSHTHLTVNVIFLFTFVKYSEH